MFLIYELVLIFSNKIILYIISHKIHFKGIHVLFKKKNNKLFKVNVFFF